MNLFEISEVDKSKEGIITAINKNKLPYELVAINKYYSSMAVVYDRDEGDLFYINVVGERIRKEWRAPGHGGSFGPNYHLLDERFSNYESVELTNKKREYTTCARAELHEIMKEGWFPEGV